MGVQTAELRTAVMKIGEEINKGSSSADPSGDSPPGGSGGPGGEEGTTYDADVKDAPKDKK